MKKTLFTLLDLKAGSVGVVFPADNAEVAERSIALGLAPDALPSIYPADFVLLQIGEIDLSNGSIVPPEHPLTVCNVEEILSKYRKDK